MNIRSKKGFALGIAIMFIILAAVTSLAMYYNAFYISKEVMIDEVNSTRGYYLAMSGLRYAYILLRNPTDADGFHFNNADMDGESSTITITGTSTIGADLGLSGNNKITITAQEWNSGITEWSNGNYKVTATFSS